MDCPIDAEKERLIKLIEDDLQFVDLPKDLICSHCGGVPIFHYVYPCQHPYCRDCYVDVCQKHMKKCRVCKTEIGTQMIQNKEIEFAIYNLVVVCPNKALGCHDEITLCKLLNHLKECKFSKERHTSETTIAQAAEISADLKPFLEEMKMIMIDLVKSCKNSADLDERLLNDNKRLTKETEQLAEDVRKLTEENRYMSGDLQTLSGDVQTLVDENKIMRKQITDLKEHEEEFQKNFRLLTDTVATIGQKSEITTLDCCEEQEPATEDIHHRRNRGARHHCGHGAGVGRGIDYGWKGRTLAAVQPSTFERVVGLTRPKNNVPVYRSEAMRAWVNGDQTNDLGGPPFNNRGRYHHLYPK